MSHTQALVGARSGQLRSARKLSRSAVDAALHTGQHERAPTYEAEAAVYEALAGNVAVAKENALTPWHCRGVAMWSLLLLSHWP
jgi:hypothetical protein